MCAVLEIGRTTYRYEGRQEQWTELRMRMREIAQTRVRYGYRMIRVLLNREGWKVGKDLVYRLYKDEGLGLRKRPSGRAPRGGASSGTVPSNRPQPGLGDGLRVGSTQRWQTFPFADGRGHLHRESLAIEAGQSLRGEDVVRVLNRLKERGVPRMLFCDNGASLQGK